MAGGTYEDFIRATAAHAMGGILWSPKHYVVIPEGRSEEDIRTAIIDSIKGSIRTVLYIYRMRERLAQDLAACCPPARPAPAADAKAATPCEAAGPVAFDPAWVRWHGGTVGLIARLILQNGAYSELPVLADALEEAGCGDAALLGHLRTDSTHGEGCWGLRLVLAFLREDGASGTG